MIKVLFFAALREQLDCSEISIAPTEASTIAELQQRLSENGENWAKALENTNLLCALNQEMCEPNQAISSGDEVAFFPPVTGG